MSVLFVVMLVLIRLCCVKSHTFILDKSGMYRGVTCAHAASSVQWLLDHASANEDNFDDGEPVLITHLNCFPEVMVAVQGIYSYV